MLCPKCCMMDLDAYSPHEEYSLLSSPIEYCKTASDRERGPTPYVKDDYKTLLRGVYSSRQKVTITNFFDPLQSKTMTKKQWLALLALYVTYLFLGACVFFYLEKDVESVQRENDYKLYEKLVAAIKEYGLNESITWDLENYCGRPLTENADLDEITPRLWDFYNSVFFVITVVSTVGYGNIHPSTPLTRAIMMFYAMIGIPMNGILLTSLAQFFSTVFIRAHKKFKRYESRCGLAMDVLKYLVPGILFFIFLPATAFYYFEGWTYDESVYFAFVSLTTIGFGDMVAGQKQFKEFDSDLILLYKSLLLCWIIFGLGYLIMILGFITRAMRSKKMAQFEHKLVEALTHSKIWHGFSKDVSYLRRVMNELYLDKFKPVYLDEHPQQKFIFHRSKSLPNFTFGVDEEDFFDPVDLLKRKRASSDYMCTKMKVSRVCSESDLHRIDRRATFASVSKIHPDEVIRHVVGVMGGGSRPRQEPTENEPKGVDVFSDDEILKSEAWFGRKDTSVASINYPPTYEEAISPRRKRFRTLSECRPMTNLPASAENLEWTWSGTGSTKIFELVNERHKRSQMRQSEKSKRKLSSNLRWFNPRRKRIKSYSDSISGSKKSICSDGELVASESGRALKYKNEGHYVTYTAGSGAQGIGLMHGKRGLSKPERSLVELYMSGDHLFSGENREEALEGTSLADFLSALSSLHNRVGNQKGEGSATPSSTSSPKIESLVGLFTPEPLPKPRAKVQEPSNLKKLGRFLLRSYSKTDPNAESIPIQKESLRSSNRKSLPARSCDSYLSSDNYHTVVGNTSLPAAAAAAAAACEDNRTPNGRFSNFNVEEPAISRRNPSKRNSIMSNMSFRRRRGSTPAMTSELGPLPNERTRIGFSTESIFTDSRRFSAIRWRPGESCSAKPSLSDVKEITK